MKPRAVTAASRRARSARFGASAVRRDGVRVSSYASWMTSNVPESVSVIPEPVSLSLMLAGTAAVLARRRRA